MLQSSVKAISEELDRILASQAFLSADRRARLLRFLVEQSLADHTDALKESVIAIEVFHRPADYNPKLDSIVRVEMGRLRSRLSEYYSQAGLHDPVRIEIPKGGYQPTFVFHEQNPKRSPALLALALTIVLCLALFALWGFRVGAHAGPVSI